MLPAHQPRSSCSSATTGVCVLHRCAVTGRRDRLSACTLAPCPSPAPRSPFVVHLKPAITQLAKEYQAKGIKVLAISSNSVETHPKVSGCGSDTKVGGYGFVPLRSCRTLSPCPTQSRPERPQPPACCPKQRQPQRTADERQLLYPPHRHAQDGPEKMAEDAKEQGYTFPYLFDDSQDVAKAYCAGGAGVLATDGHGWGGHRLGGAWVQQCCSAGSDGPLHLPSFSLPSPLHPSSDPQPSPNTHPLAAACTPEFYVFDGEMKLTYHGGPGSVQDAASWLLLWLRHTPGCPPHPSSPHRPVRRQPAQQVWRRQAGHGCGGVGFGWF